MLSSLKRHVEARKFAQEAVDHVLGTIKDLEDPDLSCQYINVDHDSLYNTVTIAWFNLAAEQEHMNDLHDALDSYTAAQKYAKKSNIITLK